MMPRSPRKPVLKTSYGNALRINFMNRECSKSEFENLTGVSLSNDMFSENEFGTQDAKVWITEEDGEEFKITIEINEEDFITHCYYEEI